MDGSITAIYTCRLVSVSDYFYSEVLKLADVQPFQGIRYSAGLDLGQLLCPPYDVISPAQQKELHGKSPINAIRLEFGEEKESDTITDNRYTRAAETLKDWVNQSVLILDKDPAYYILQETFTHLGIKKTRKSIIARVRVEEFASRTILPHEETSSGPKKDRMQILEATKANLSPIMSIYRDDEGIISDIVENRTQENSLIDVEYKDVSIKLWPVSDLHSVETISNAFKGIPIFLADGHHRYETALSYSKLQNKPNGPHNFVMMSLLEIEDPGLLVLPYHRMLKSIDSDQEEKILALIRSHFKLIREDAINGDIGNIKEAGAFLGQGLESDRDGLSFGVVYAGGTKLDTFAIASDLDNTLPAVEKCPTWIIEKKVLEPAMGTQESIVDEGILHFTHEAAEVVAGVKEGNYKIGMLLPPMPLQLFEEVVLSGDRMPIKSTYFIPKLPTGVVINPLT